MSTLLSLVRAICLLQSVEYRSTAGVEDRSSATPAAIARAESALAADPRNADRIIALGVAQSGVRSTRSVATFTRGLGLGTDNRLAVYAAASSLFLHAAIRQGDDDLQRGAKTRQHDLRDLVSPGHR